jgi:hypothetical protein
MTTGFMMKKGQDEGLYVTRNLEILGSVVINWLSHWIITVPLIIHWLSIVSYRITLSNKKEGVLGYFLELPEMHFLGKSGNGKLMQVLEEKAFK